MSNLNFKSIVKTETRTVCDYLNLLPKPQVEESISSWVKFNKEVFKTENVSHEVKYFKDNMGNFYRLVLRKNNELIFIFAYEAGDAYYSHADQIKKVEIENFSFETSEIETVLTKIESTFLQLV
jgi:hypothetical protein